MAVAAAAAAARATRPQQASGRRQNQCDTKPQREELRREPPKSCGTSQHLKAKKEEDNLFLTLSTKRRGATLLAAASLLFACQLVAAAAAQRGTLLTVSIGLGGGGGANSSRTLSKRSAPSAKLRDLDALNYLQRYGYMNGTGANANLISEDAFHEAVTSFQRFAGIPETGSVDQLTVRYMQMPRCGNRDLSSKGESGKRKRRRRKRYALQGSKWRRQELTYRISQYPSRFGGSRRQEVDSQIEKAFRIWSQVAPIEFVVKKEGRVHIDIRFASGEHGDGDPFDGPGNTLAHAYFPQYGGDAHFDDQEYWTVDSFAGTNIFQVAAHELGHSLGLGHSSVREALMAPFYQKYKPNFKLHADDVLAIQALYGERGGGGSDSGDTPTSTAPASTTEQPPAARRTFRPPTAAGGDDADGDKFAPGKPVDLCQDAKIDAITRTEDGSTYVFRGQFYWLVKNEGIASGYPARISRDWDGLPGNLDAALTWSDGKTFFFKGDKYWRYSNRRREPGYPKQISVGFAGIPNNLDAAFVWNGNGKTYFVKRDKYWRFDSKQEPPVSSQYPKSLKNWAGLPAAGVDAAFKWENGMTYFFKDELYYRFDDREFEVDSAARPQFPRSTAEWWFGCTNSNLPIRSAAPNELDEAAAGSSSLLMFHRRPNLVLEGVGVGGGDEGARPSGGNSLSRSLLASLNSLFGGGGGGSADSTPTPPTTRQPPPADWSFHSGIGEEIRRLSSRARNLAAARANAAGPNGNGNKRDDDDNSTNRVPQANGPAVAETSRWLLPARGEQSSSELRLATTELEATAPAAKRRRRRRANS